MFVLYCLGQRGTKKGEGGEMSEVLVGLGIPFCSWGSMHLV